MALLGWAGLHFPATQTVFVHSTDTSQRAVLGLDTADGEQSVEKGTQGSKRSSSRRPPLHLLYLVLRFHSSAPSWQDLSFLHHCQPAHGSWLSANYLGLSGGSDGKESACNGRDLGLIPGLGRSLGEGNSTIHSSGESIQFMGSQRVGHDWVTSTFITFQDILMINIINDVC